jgi:hypothetical protein
MTSRIFNVRRGGITGRGPATQIVPLSAAVSAAAGNISFG